MNNERMIDNLMIARDSIAQSMMNLSMNIDSADAISAFSIILARIARILDAIILNHAIPEYNDELLEAISIACDFLPYSEDLNSALISLT